MLWKNKIFWFQVKGKVCFSPHYAYNSYASFIIGLLSAVFLYVILYDHLHCLLLLGSNFLICIWHFSMHTTMCRHIRCDIRNLKCKIDSFSSLAPVFVFLMSSLWFFFFLNWSEKKITELSLQLVTKWWKPRSSSADGMCSRNWFKDGLELRCAIYLCFGNEIQCPEHLGEIIFKTNNHIWFPNFLINIWYYNRILKPFLKLLLGRKICIRFL